MTRVLALAVAAGRLARGLAARPCVVAQPMSVIRTDGSTGVSRPVDVTVVVPARDEAGRIGPLLESLRRAPGVHEVIVVDDGSIDATAVVAAKAGCTLLRVDGPPPGWAGKTWALHRGVEAATTEWIVTVDADVDPDPRLPLAVVDRAVTDHIDLLTVGGRTELADRGARWLHAAMLTQLVYRFGPPGTSRRLANGQCMASRRSTLLAGLRAVRDQPVEDVALARHLASTRRRVDFLDATELMLVRPYGAVADVWSGWGRSIGLRGIEPGWRQLGELVLLAMAAPVPMLRLAAGRADTVDGAALALRLGVLVGTSRAYEPRGVPYWVSPVADPLALAATVTGLLRRRPTWRGRSVVP